MVTTNDTQWPGVRPPKPHRYIPVEERFRMSYVVPQGPGCWIWVRSKDLGGYPLFYVDGRILKAHRYSYARFVGPIPDGLTIDHLCRTRSCVCPTHLEAVTSRVNILRGRGPAAINAAKTHCLRGHEFNIENTWKAKTKRMRQCRICTRLRKRERRARLKAQPSE